MSEYIIDLNDENANVVFGICDGIHQEIVRCRDCKHFTPNGTHKFENGKVNADYCKYVRGWMLQIAPDGFCAWGERKSEMSELKPCPFCGGQPEMRESSTHDFYIKCKGCGVATRKNHENRVGAVMDWNARAERMCRMKQKYECQYDDIECSECGAALWAFTMDLGRDGIVVTPNYCPNCGALVISEND